MDAVKRLDRLKSDLSEVQSKAAVAKAERERLTKELKSLLAELGDMGYSSFEEAKKGLAKLETEVEEMFEEVELSVSELRSQLQ